MKVVLGWSGLSVVAAVVVGGGGGYPWGYDCPYWITPGLRLPGGPPLPVLSQVMILGIITNSAPPRL